MTHFAPSAIGSTWMNDHTSVFDNVAILIPNNKPPILLTCEIGDVNEAAPTFSCSTIVSIGANIGSGGRELTRMKAHTKQIS